MDTILQGDSLRRPAAAHGWELLAALLAGALTTLVLSRSGAIAGLPLLLAGSAALWGGAFWLFARGGLFLSPLVPQAVLAGDFALLSFLRFRQSEREAAAFSRKLSLTQDVIIQSMAALAETRDNETGGHIQRTRHYVKPLAESLRATRASAASSTTRPSNCSSGSRRCTTSARSACATTSCSSPSG